MAFERISIDHEKMGGLSCIRDLRIPVSTVLGQLAAGRDTREILEDFPDLEPADVSLPWSMPLRRFRSANCRSPPGGEAPSRLQLVTSCCAIAT